MSYTQKWKTNRESGPEIVLKHDGNPLVSGRIWVDGVQADIRSAKVYRDGGSQRFVTDKGDLFLNRRLGDDHYQTWDGEVLIEVDEDEDETLPVQTRSDEGALRYFKTIQDAINYANKPRNKVWKISWHNAKTNERVRLIKVATIGSHLWTYEDIFTDLRDET